VPETGRTTDSDMPLLPWINQENFNPGYLMRGMHLLPKRGDKLEWRHTQDYWTERTSFLRSTSRVPNSLTADPPGDRFAPPKAAAGHRSAGSTWADRRN
jgi:hypothetical protein